MKPTQHAAFNVNHHVLSRPPVIAQYGRVPSPILNDYSFSAAFQSVTTFDAQLSRNYPNYHKDSRPPVIPSR